MLKPKQSLKNNLLKSKERFYVVTNRSWVSKELIVEINSKWEHYLLTAKGSVKLPYGFKRSNAFSELEKRNQISVKEVIE
jgi:hypothetical protein